MKLRYSHLIIALTVIIFGLQNLPPLFTGTDIFLIYGAKINEFILKGEVWRFLTPVLLHGYIFHLGFNMYAIYSIGPTLEKIFGSLSFVLLYIISAVFGNIFSFIFSPHASIGASTAIFGLIAAQGVYIFKNRHLLGSASRSLLVNVILVMVVNLLIGLSPGLVNWGHLGGLIGGFFYSWFSVPTFSISQNLFGENVIIKDNKRILLITAAILALAIILAGFGFFIKSITL